MGLAEALESVRNEDYASTGHIPSLASHFSGQKDMPHQEQKDPRLAGLFALWFSARIFFKAERQICNDQVRLMMQTTEPASARRLACRDTVRKPCTYDGEAQAPHNLDIQLHTCA
jgi:hypothetical protein